MMKAGGNITEIHCEADIPSIQTYGIMFPACMDVVQVEPASPIMAPAQSRAYHIVSHISN